MTLSKEDKLLLLCSKLILDDSNINEVVQLLQKKLDWQKIVRNAKRYSIASALFCILTKIPNNNLIQEKYLLQLKEEYLDTLGRNTIVFNELKFLLKILKEANIEVVLLKGTALLASVYPGLAYRFMSDIDILVQDSDLSKVQENLLANGYTQNKPTYNLQKKNHHHLAPIWNPANNIRIEIHWTLGITNTVFNIDINEVWSRIQKIKIGTMKTLILSPEDLILHLGFHLYFNFVNIMIFRTLYDITTIIQNFKDSIDWNLIADCCFKYHLETPVYALLFLIKYQLALEIPDEVMSQLRAETSTDQITWMEVNYKNSGMETIGRNFCTIPGFRRKITFIFSKIFPPVEYLYYKYSLPTNSKFVYLYYIIRPFHLLFRYSISTMITIFKLSLLFSRNYSNQKIEKSIYNILADRQ